MARYTHDLIIIGAGAAGLTAASGSAQLGLKVALVEKAHMGGDCLYYGCVPSKSLLKTAGIRHAAAEGARFGLGAATAPEVDMERVNERVQGVIQSIAYHDSPERFEKLGAEVHLGNPSFRSPHEVEVNDGTVMSAPRILLATGSGPAALPLPGLAEAGYLTNIDVFSLKKLPESLFVIGGGPIGVEMAQAFTRLGTRVTLADIAPHVLPREDADMASLVQAKLEQEGVSLRLGAKISGITAGGAGRQISLTTASGDQETIDVEQILVAAGRKGNTDGLELERAGVTVERSFIPVNDRLQTSQKHIYAAGDINGRFLFTHVAGAEGSLFVRRVVLHAGGKMDYTNVPWVTYCDPELASVGYNEQRAQAEGLKYEAIIQDFSANDRAQAEGEAGGRLKILIDRKDRVLGAQIAGYHAGDLITPALFARAEGWKLSRIRGAWMPYPTMGEVWGKAISGHLAPRLFNPRVRGILRTLFRYRGAGPQPGAH